MFFHFYFLLETLKHSIISATGFQISDPSCSQYHNTVCDVKISATKEQSCHVFECFLLERNTAYCKWELGTTVCNAVECDARHRFRNRFGKRKTQCACHMRVEISAFVTFMWSAACYSYINGIPSSSHTRQEVPYNILLSSDSSDNKYYIYMDRRLSLTRRQWVEVCALRTQCRAVGPLSSIAVLLHYATSVRLFFHKSSD